MNKLHNLLIIPVMTLVCVQAVHAECLNGAAVIAAIVDKNSGLDAEARHDKYLGMAKSPFSFLRATNHLFWACYGNDKDLEEFGGKTETRTWIQGDLHTDNFGTYNFGAFDDDAGNKQIVYDLTDFDEAVIADYQYDVWRLAATLVVIAEHHDMGKKEVTEAFVDAYLDSLEHYVGNKDELERQKPKEKLPTLISGVEAEKNPRKAMLDKRAPRSNDGHGHRLFDTTNRPKLAPASDSEDEAIRGAMAAYRGTLEAPALDEGYFTVKDVARRIKSGLGGLGLDRYYVLIQGKTDSPDDDVILDIKYQPKPTPIEYLSASEQEWYQQHFNNDHGRRQATAYRALVGDADPHLGWMVLPQGQYSVRERSPFKAALPISYLDDQQDFVVMARQWGAILAANHARADKDFDNTLVPFSLEKEVTERTAGKKKEFRKRVYKIAKEFADQVEEDWKTFRERLSVTLTAQ